MRKDNRVTCSRYPDFSVSDAERNVYEVFSGSEDSEESRIENFDKKNIFSMPREMFLMPG